MILKRLYFDDCKEKFRNGKSSVKRKQLRMKPLCPCIILLALLCQMTLAMPDFCSLPSASGPCEAWIPSFYYDTTSNTCKEFIYGGCIGNQNRFSTKQLCEQTCS
ncbi:hypothetical protein Btru_043123 [Bulinus truncatus]|nr:hypothetical protein Btru_043123 [Bulinus truncatus]